MEGKPAGEDSSAASGPTQDNDSCQFWDCLCRKINNNRADVCLNCNKSKDYTIEKFCDNLLNIGYLAVPVCVIIALLASYAILAHGQG